MPRRSRSGSGGVVFHVINRAARRSTLFPKSADYQTFLEAMAEASSHVSMRLLDYCIMPNHFHLILWPVADGDLSRYMAWLTTRHAQRWRRINGTAGEGAVYQGRFRAIPVQSDHHFLIACRYVERNPIRAGLVRRAEDWSWSSASPHGENCNVPHLSRWPILQPADWLDLVNGEDPLGGEESIRMSIRRSRPFGHEAWRNETAAALGIRRERRGRPTPVSADPRCPGCRRRSKTNPITRGERIVDPLLEGM
jgi:putative transposase